MTMTTTDLNGDLLGLDDARRAELGAAGIF